MTVQPVGQLNATVQNFTTTAVPDGLNNKSVTTYTQKKRPMAADPVAQGS